MTAPHLLVYTKPNMEQTAVKHLTSEGATVYMPQFLRERYHARVRDKVPSPLFPRYLFVEDDGVSVRMVRSARGVSDVLHRTEAPIIVRGDVIDALHAREGADGFIQIEPLVRGGTPYKRGEALHIRDDDSVLDGFLVKFIELTHGQRAMVAFQLFGGGWSPTEISLSHLERAVRNVA